MEEILGYGASAVVGLMGLLYSESIKRIIDGYFSGLSRKQVSTLFYILLIVCVAAPAISGHLAAPAPRQLQQQEVENAVADEQEHNNSNEELIAAGIDLASDLLNNKQKKDSVKKAGRKTMWAYQVGSPKRRQAAWSLYEKIKHIPGICFFKEGRKTYRVIKYTGNADEAQMKDSLHEIIHEMEGFNEEVQVVDLMNLCSKKEHIVETEGEENAENSIRCYECSK